MQSGRANHREGHESSDLWVGEGPDLYVFTHPRERRVAAQKQDRRKSQLQMNTPDKKIFNMGRNMVRISQQLCTEQSASVSVSKDPKEICNTARAKCFLSSISIGLFVFPNLLLHSLSSCQRLTASLSLKVIYCLVTSR